VAGINIIRPLKWQSVEGRGARDRCCCSRTPGQVRPPEPQPLLSGPARRGWCCRRSPEGRAAPGACERARQTRRPRAHSTMEVDSTGFAILFALCIMVVICCILVMCIPIRNMIANARMKAAEAMAEAQQRARSLGGKSKVYAVDGP
jgi:hypothetical protein